MSRASAGRVSALLLWLLAALFLAGPARAQTFPELTGRVVDQANIIPADERARLDQKLAGLEQQSRRQLVVVTLADLQGYDIADYGYQLGRHWGVGSKERNDGALLIVAPKERKVRIEIGYGLEGVLTDGLSSLIIQQIIIPKFKAGDMPGGIEAGTDAIIRQLSLPADQARQAAASASSRPAPDQGSGAGALIIIAIIVLLFFVLPIIQALRGHSGGFFFWWLLWDVVSSLLSSGGRGGGSGGGFGGGGGGFSGGGGSFGGGGSSGGW